VITRLRRLFLGSAREPEALPEPPGRKKPPRRRPASEAERRIEAARHRLRQTIPPRED
jgi:hypothetical protein